MPQPASRLRLLFEGRQAGGELIVRETLALLLIGPAFERKCPVVDPAHTAEGASKHLLLLVSWIALVAVCTLEYAHTGLFFFAPWKP